MSKIQNCLECNEKLTLKKDTGLLACKNKSCLKTYSIKDYNQQYQDQQKEMSLLRDLEKLIDNEKFINTTPQKYFLLGDMVDSIYGKNFKVIEKSSEKFYLIGNEKSEKYFWVRWHELSYSSAEKAQILFNKRSERIDKRISFGNRRLDGVIHYYYKSKLNMNPEYQRDFVWEQSHKTALIDSIFSGSDIGKMIFIRLPWKEDSFQYEILDGKQRLSTIVDFLEDRFPYKGFYFSQLQDLDQSEFLGAMVSVGETDEGFTEDDKIRYFLTVNNTGVPQDPKLLDQLKEKLKKK